jgi:hypothetical protein
MTRHPVLAPTFARTFAEWAIEQMVARYSLLDAAPVIPLLPAPGRGDIHTAFGRFVRARPSAAGLFDVRYNHFEIPAAAPVMPWLPSPRQAVRTLPSRLDIVTDAFGYDHTGRPTVLPPRRPLVRITPAHRAHWRAFVRFFGPHCEFALHTAAAGARRTPARCQ